MPVRTIIARKFYLWLAGRTLSGGLGRGEHVLGMARETDERGMVWVATNQALYLELSPTRANEDRRATSFNVVIGWGRLLVFREELASDHHTKRSILVESPEGGSPLLFEGVFKKSRELVDLSEILDEAIKGSRR